VRVFSFLFGERVNLADNYPQERDFTDEMTFECRDLCEHYADKIGSITRFCFIIILAKKMDFR